VAEPPLREGERLERERRRRARDHLPALDRVAALLDRDAKPVKPRARHDHRPARRAAYLRGT
jgi:hypothetical protein